MEYGINIKFFQKTLELKKAAELIAGAGFTQLDYTPNLRSDSWKEEVRDAMEIFRQNGLTVHQTHAPYNRYRQYGNMLKLCLDRCAEATEIMGAKFMVVHGDEFDFNNMVFSPEAALDYNHHLFLPYVEQAKQSGYKVAFETVFEDLNRRRYTSKADELMALITSFHSDSAVCCWDFGHSHVSFKKDAPDLIRQFASLIQCTHLHDNAGNDSHQMPMTGDIDWNATISAFKEIGYSGVISVEYAHGSIPEAMAEDFIRLTCKAARHIWNTFI